MTEETKEDVISSLTGTALRVFVYTVKKNQDISVRETQRDLGFTNVSKAQYHLQRLQQLGLLYQDENNKYFLAEECQKFRSLKLGILTEIYIFKNQIIPSIGLFAGFLGMSTIITIAFYFLSPLTSLIYASIALGLGTIYGLFQAIQIVKTFNEGN